MVPCVDNEIVIGDIEGPGLLPRVQKLTEMVDDLLSKGNHCCACDKAHEQSEERIALLTIAAQVYDEFRTGCELYGQAKTLLSEEFSRLSRSRLPELK